MLFKNRRRAGELLSRLLNQFRQQQNTIVLGLPRGGVATAYEVALHLKLPLDVICPRKIGAPFNPELGIGAITERGIRFLNEALVRDLNISQEYILQESEKEKKIAEMRSKLYRPHRPPLQLEGKTVILVDDGLATGGTMKVAIQAVKAEKVKKVIVAVPVSPKETLSEIERLADAVFCLQSPSPFYAVGQFYDDFAQTEDEEVIELLNQAYEHS